MKVFVGDGEWTRVCCGVNNRAAAWPRIQLHCCLTTIICTCAATDKRGTGTRKENSSQRTGSPWRWARLTFSRVLRIYIIGFLRQCKNTNEQSRFSGDSSRPFWTVFFSGKSLRGFLYCTLMSASTTHKSGHYPPRMTPLLLRGTKTANNRLLDEPLSPVCSLPSLLLLLLRRLAKVKTKKAGSTALVPRAQQLRFNNLVQQVDDPKLDAYLYPNW